MKNAVLFLVFNRPDLTRQVFDAIRAARPPRLYVVADGPRAGRLGEADRCVEVRRIATSVDWECELHTLFRESNVGCKISVSGGISWFFENEEQGIILEDDVLPIPSFFDYCEELLDRYKCNERVAMISGCNLVSKRMVSSESYFFSLYNHIWGWASWRRAWRNYDVRMKEWSSWVDEGGLKRIANGDKLFESYWRLIMGNALSRNIDTWDYQWTFACWKSNALTILPQQNQTCNLGFGAEATHTTQDVPSYVGESPPLPLNGPLIHPKFVVCNTKADAIIGKYIYKINNITIAKLKLLSYPATTMLIKAFRKCRVPLGI